jgi:intein/homing endonuclease
VSSFPLTPELAEVIGLNLGDGCVCRYLSRGRPSFQVAFTAGPDEFWYYRDFIQPTIEKTFSVKGSLYLRSDNTTRYHISGDRLALYLIGLGLPVGKKRDAEIPRPIIEQGLIVPFIRGIYHAEGSIYRRYSKMYNRHIRIYSNLLVIQIRMKLKTLMNQIWTELKGLGIVVNRLTEKDGVFTLRITNQHEIEKFLRVVQPKYKLCPAPASL